MVGSVSKAFYQVRDAPMASHLTTKELSLLGRSVCFVLFLLMVLVSITLNGQVVQFQLRQDDPWGSAPVNTFGGPTMNSRDKDPMGWLMNWYRSRCDGDWEHQYGIKIGTLDNPGWFLDVDLSETPEEGRTEKRDLIERSEHDWLFSEAKDNMFRARGGPGNLGEIIGAFRAFVDEGKSINWDWIPGVECGPLRFGEPLPQLAAVEISRLAPDCEEADWQTYRVGDEEARIRVAEGVIVAIECTKSLCYLGRVELLGMSLKAAQTTLGEILALRESWDEEAMYESENLGLTLWIEGGFIESATVEGLC
jgi:hypothetical protein